MVTINNKYDLIIVGGGLRLLSFLTALVDIFYSERGEDGWSKRTQRRVLVLDPNHPGPGAVWDDLGPEEFLCNALSYEAALPGPAGRALWIGGIAELGAKQRTIQGAPPRKEIGAIIRRERDRLISILEPRVRVYLAARRADLIKPHENTWLVRSKTITYTCNGVVDLTGSGFTGYEIRAGENSCSDLDCIPMNASVLVGGMGLGAIDVVSVLTKGRGGTFSELDGELAYVPSGKEPKITLRSRSERLRIPTDPSVSQPPARGLLQMLSKTPLDNKNTDEVLQGLTDLVDNARSKRQMVGSPYRQIIEFEREPAVTRVKQRCEIERTIESLVSNNPQMSRINQELISQIASEFTSGPPIQRYREWGALFRAGVLRFSEGRWEECDIDNFWRVRAFVGNSCLPYSCPYGELGSENEIPVDPLTKRAVGFARWWAAGHSSTHPLRGDLPTITNLQEWQAAVVPLAMDVVSKVGLLDS